jgi:hypothetical protein
MEKYINGVKVTDNIISKGRPVCQFSDYIAARETKHMRWSEKSFCDWCDKHNVDANG